MSAAISRGDAVSDMTLLSSRLDIPFVRTASRCPRLCRCDKLTRERAVFCNNLSYYMLYHQCVSSVGLTTYLIQYSGILSIVSTV